MFSIIRKCKMFSVGAIFWIPGIIVLFVLTPFLMFRLGVNLLARILRPDLIPICNPIDHLATAAPFDHHHICNTVASLLLKEKLDIELFRERFTKVFLSSTELRSRYQNLYCYFVKWGYYMFKKSVTQINLNERIREITLEINDVREVERFVEEYANINSFGENPNWEILLIQLKPFSLVNEEIYDLKLKGVKTILVWKIDHGLCDGHSMNNLLDKLSDCGTPYHHQTRQMTYLEMACIIFYSPLNTFKLFAGMARGGDIAWPNYENRNRKEMFLSVCELDLEKFKRIRRIFGCHFVTLLGVLQVEAIKRYFSAKRSEANMPNQVWIWSPIGMPNHPVMLGGPIQNHFSMIGFKVNNDDMNLVSKVHKAEEHYCKMQGDWLVSVNNFVTVLPLAWVFPHGVLKILADIFQSLKISTKLGLSLSSMPGPGMHDEYKILGKSASKMMVHGNLLSSVQSTRLQIITVSNNKSLVLSVAGRKDTFGNVEDIDFIAKVILKEIFEDITTQLQLQI